MARLSTWRLCLYCRIHVAFWSFWKTATSPGIPHRRLQRKIQVSHSGWLSIKRSEKGDRFALCSLCNSSYSITHQTFNTGMWKDPHMRRKTKLKIASLSKKSDARCSKCFSLHSQISKSIIFKQKPFVYKVFYDVMAHWSFFCQKKNIGKNPLSPIGSIFQGNFTMKFFS